MLPLSLLGFVGIVGVAAQSTTVVPGPVCAASESSSVATAKDTKTADERIYYIGCGGLF